MGRPSAEPRQRICAGYGLRLVLAISRVKYGMCSLRWVGDIRVVLGVMAPKGGSRLVDRQSGRAFGWLVGFT